MKKIILLLSVCSMLLGCATSGIPIDKIAMPNKDEGYGIIFGSITFVKEKPNYNGYTIVVDNQMSEKAKDDEWIILRPNQTFKASHAGELDNGRTYLFIRKIKIGKYKINNVRLFSNSGIAALQNTKIDNSVEIDFNLEENKVIYVGNIVYDDWSKTQNKLIKIENNFERDKLFLSEKQNLIDWNNAQNLIKN
jgi:hypothetical protein